MAPSDHVPRDLDAAGFLKAVGKRDAIAVNTVLEKMRESDGEESVHALLSFADDRGNTLLHRCARGVAPKRGSHVISENDQGVALTKLLLESRANVNAINHAGETPLLSAARSPNLPPLGLARTLLEARSDVCRAESASGQGPLMEAMKRGDSALCRLLLEWKADLAQQNASGLDAIDMAMVVGGDVQSLITLIGENAIQDWRQRKQAKQGSAAMAPLCGQLTAVVDDVRAALGRPLEYKVVHAPHIDIYQGPSIESAAVGHLKHGAVVQGLPAGQWLFIDMTGAPPTGGAWVPVAGAHLGKGRLLSPLWAAVVAVAPDSPGEAVELSWPGIPNTDAAYVVQWRLWDSSNASEAVVDSMQDHVSACPAGRSSSGQHSVGADPCAILYDLPRAPGLQVRILACISGPQKPPVTIQLYGAWVDVCLDCDEESFKSLPQKRACLAEGFMTTPQDDIAHERLFDRTLQLHGQCSSQAGVTDQAQTGNALGVAHQLPPRLLSTAITLVPAPQENADKHGLENDPRSVIPYCRLIVAQSKPPVVCVEMNNPATFNMMDAILGNDVLYGIEVAQKHFVRNTDLKAPLGAYVVQGAGPHFCPGGNPSPDVQPGFHRFCMSSFCTYTPFVRIREAGVPIVCGSHGTQVGGGVAFPVGHTARLGASSNSWSYGNLSRGAVPGMVLSRNVTYLLGLQGAMSVYLGDSTLSIYGAVAGGLATGVSFTPKSVKEDAAMMARRLSVSPCASLVSTMSTPYDFERVCNECRGMHLSAITGTMFQNLKAKKKKSPDEEDDTAERPPEIKLEPEALPQEKRSKKVSMLSTLHNDLPRFMTTLSDNALFCETGGSGTRFLKRVDEKGKVTGEASIQEVEAIDTKYSRAVEDYQNGKNSAHAESVLRACLDSYDGLVGPGHHRTMHCMNSLAAVLYVQNRIEEAEPLLRRALQLHMRALGGLHPQTLSCMSNLALCYQAQGNAEKAAPLLRDALAGLERSRGPLHPSTNTVASNLAGCLQEMGKAQEAEPFIKKAMNAQHTAYGPNHPNSLTLVANVASCVHDMGNIEEANLYFASALKGMRTVLGINHPSTQLVLKNYASLLDETDQAKEAAELRKEIVA